MPSPTVPGHALPATRAWSDDLIAEAGIPVVDVPFVTVGGGIGSFVTVDYLRIAGVPTENIRVLTTLDVPWQTYEYLTRVSQIPRGERIRSDSSSRPDNIWGFPSYALSEALETRRLAPLFQVAVEPVFTDYYTPDAGQVFRGLARECARIGYDGCVVKGRVSVVRQRDGGGYFSLLSDRETGRTVAYRSRFVHLALGYPGLNYLADLRGFREEHGRERVVNAYEPHEHVYASLAARPSTVLVRGAGIVASRVLQRLFDDREAGARTTVIQLFRTSVEGAHGPHRWMRRRGGDGWAYQGFNYPKSAWGGQLKHRMRRLEGQERADLYALIGGTNTPRRKRWQRQLAAGRRDGFYAGLSGTVDSMAPTGTGVTVKAQTPEGVRELHVDYVLDCTGLEADIAADPVLADLLDRGGAGRNPIGRLDVERSFEVRGTASGDGAIYASGASTLGGYFPGVDTFLGLQIAAQEICDDLAARGFCRRIGPVRSLRQWVKWVQNRGV